MVSCTSDPGDSRVAVELAHLAAGGVDLDPLGAGAPRNSASIRASTL
jgi:hypothetical protein